MNEEMNHDEMIAVIQAHKDGVEIERENEFGWISIACSITPAFNFAGYVYRVKPKQPKLLSVATNRRDGGYEVLGAGYPINYIELTDEVRALLGGLVDE